MVGHQGLSLASAGLYRRNFLLTREGEEKEVGGGMNGIDNHAEYFIHIAVNIE